MDMDMDETGGGSSATSRSGTGGISNKNIGVLHEPIEKMLNVIDKLHLLQYEKEFLKLTKLPKLHRLYFVFPTNPGEQYYNFVTLCAWLIQKCGRRIEIPQESEDPNEVITLLLKHVREMGGIIDFSQSKVKSGSGPDVVSVLDFLTDKALDGLAFLTPQFPDVAATVTDREDYEIDMAKIEQEMATLYNNDNFGLSDLMESGLIGMFPKDETPLPDHMKIIVSDVDPEDWRLEVERVFPQLSVPVIDENYDWSKRQVQLKTLSEQVTGVISQTKPPMKKLTTDIFESIEKLTARETTLSKHADLALSELAATQDKVAELREKQKGLNAEIIEKNRELARISDDVDASRRKLDERGNVMADGAPVTQARKDLAALKQEISNMDVEVGVMEHYILKSMVQDQATYLARK